MLCIFLNNIYAKGGRNAEHYACASSLNVPHLNPSVIHFQQKKSFHAKQTEKYNGSRVPSSSAQ